MSGELNTKLESLAGRKRHRQSIHPDLTLTKAVETEEEMFQTFKAVVAEEKDGL
eukprot:Pgem_evm2s2208